MGVGGIAALHMLVEQVTQRDPVGRWHPCLTGLVSPSSQALLANEQRRHIAKRVSNPPFPCLGNCLQEHRLCQLSALPATGSCSVYPREAVAEMIKLSSIWMKERILEHMGLLWLIKSTRPCRKSSALITINSWN